MKCDLCGKRTAVIFVQEASGSEHSELHLCAECAKERGMNRIDGDIHLSIADLFSSISDGHKLDEAVRPPVERCPSCSCTLNELKQRGMASCPTCFETFAIELFRGVYPDARSRRHVGRLPVRLAGPRQDSPETRLERARQGLRNALDSEDYEAAARCRDEIRSLEKGASSRG